MYHSKDNSWESEMEFDLRYNRWFLQSLGLWKPKNYSEKIMVKLGICFTTFLLAIFLIPHGLYVLVVENDPSMQLKFVGPISFCVMAIGKYYVVLKNKLSMESCLHFIAEDWKNISNKPEEKQILVEAGRWCDSFTKLCIFFMYGGCVFRDIFKPLFEYVTTTLTTPNATLVLHFPSYFGIRSYDISTDAGFMFEVLFFTHSVSMFYMSTITVGMCTLTTKFVMHVCCLIKIMQIHLVSTTSGVINEKWNCAQFQASLKLVVIKHLRILRFISYIENTLTGMFFVEFVGTIFGVCLLGYYVIAAIEKKDIPQTITCTLLLLSFITNFFIYCYLGNRLTEQCEQVGIRIYEINWIQLLTNKQGTVGIQMIILVSQQPPKLTAGKIIFLTMETFSSVMKISATYLNMLRKFTEGSEKHL